MGFSQHARSFRTKPGEGLFPDDVALETSISDGSLLGKVPAFHRWLIGIAHHRITAIYGVTRARLSVAIESIERRGVPQQCIADREMKKLGSLSACLVHALKHDAIAEHLLYEQAKPNKHDCAGNPAAYRHGLGEMPMRLIARECGGKQCRAEKPSRRPILDFSLAPRANRRAARNPSAAVSTSHIAHYFHDLGYRTARLRNAASPSKRIMALR